MCKTDSVNEGKYVLVECIQLLIEPKLNLFSSTNPAKFPEIELMNVHTYIKGHTLENNNSNHSRVAISRAVNGAIFNNAKWSISESRQGESFRFLVILRWARKKHEVVDEKKSLMQSSKHAQLHNP